MHPDVRKKWNDFFENFRKNTGTKPGNSLALLHFCIDIFCPGVTTVYTNIQCLPPDSNDKNFKKQ